MGKGSRKRDNSKKEQQARQRALSRAKHFDRLSMAFGVVMLICWTLILVMQIITQAAMQYNLNTGVYEKKGNAPEDIARLTDILPLGYLSVALITIGLIVFFVLLTAKKPLPSLSGGGVTVVGTVMFILFFLEIENLFPHFQVTIGGTTIDRGLNFTDMLTRYYSVAVPLLLMIPAFVTKMRAQKYREIADVIATAEQNKSTLNLGEDD